MTLDKDNPVLTAYALGELHGREREDVEAQLRGHPELQAEVDATRSTAALLMDELRDEPVPEVAETSRAEAGGATAAGGGEDALTRRRERRHPLPRGEGFGGGGAAGGAVRGRGALRGRGTLRGRGWFTKGRIAAAILAGVALLGAIVLAVGILSSSWERFTSQGHPVDPGVPSVPLARAHIALSTDQGQPKPDLAGGPLLIYPLNAVATAPAPKLIYSAQMEASVDKALAEGFSAQLGQQVEAAGGYISQASTSRATGQQPGGSITVRIPAGRLREIMDWVGGHATVLTSRLTVQDITEQYVDLESRLANLRAAEARLQGLLAKETGKLDEVLRVEQEMRRVGEEMEQLEGRQRLWDRQVAYSTLSVEYRVAGYYVAEEVTVPPARTFTQRAGAALAQSWAALVEALGAVAIGVIYGLPWLALALVPVVVGLGWYGMRRGKK